MSDVLNPTAVFSKVTALDLDPAARPMVLARRFDPSIYQLIVDRAVEVAIDNSPILNEAPSQPGKVYASPDGNQYYVPDVRLAMRGASSTTPMVFLDKAKTGYELKVSFDVVTPGGVSADAAHALPISDPTVTLVAPGVNGLPAPRFTTVLEPTPDPAVLGRITATAPIAETAIQALVLALRTTTTTLNVGTTIHYRVPVPGATTKPPDSPGWNLDLKILMEPMVLAEPVFTVRPLMSMPPLNGPGEGEPIPRVVVRPPIHVDPAPPPIVVNPVPPPPPAQPTSTSVGVAWPPINACFDPNAFASFRPIYSEIPGVKGGDSGNAWVNSSAGMWREAPGYPMYYVLPDEYRLDYDTSSGVPGMSVLLVDPPENASSTTPGGRYRVRTAFRVVPWFDATRLAGVRDAIVQQEYIPYPELIVGGVESADFVPAAIHKDLGVGQLSELTKLDMTGFEMVWDCSLEFYTLLKKLLAPGKTDPSPGPLGYLRVAMKTADGTTTRDIPLNLRLDRPAADVLRYELVDLPDPATYPVGWVPNVHVRVRSEAATPVALDAPKAVALVPRPDGSILESYPMKVEPAKITLGPATPGVMPTALPGAPPRFPGPLTKGTTDAAAVKLLQGALEAAGHDPGPADGSYGPVTEQMVKNYQKAQGLPEAGVVDEVTWRRLFPGAPIPEWPPAAAPGTALLRLTANGDHPPSPQTVGAADVAFGKIDLQLDSQAMLARVHELGASSSVMTDLTVSCYQLTPGQFEKYPGVTQLDVQIRRAGKQLDISLAPGEASQVVKVPFSVGDIAADMSPGSLPFEYRTRVQKTTGAAEWPATWITANTNLLRVTMIV